MRSSGKGDSPVAGEIRRLIERGGAIPFETYMERALYAPEGGYYTSGNEVWGRGGDYLTSVDMSPVFARVMAKQAHEMWVALGSPDRFHLVEVGAGRGTLSSAIREAVRLHYPHFSPALSSILVDPSPSLKGDKGAACYGTIEELPRKIVGCILSNELLDAFPVHIVVQGEKLEEVYVDCEGGAFVERLGPLSTPALEDYLDSAGVSLQEGQRIEINLRALDWIKKAAGALEKGFVTTIDYGYPAKEYFIPRRGGHLLCYYRHTVNEKPFERAGLQDMTSHVDFSALARSGRDAGLTVEGFTTQLNYLLGMGILEELEEVAAFDERGVESIARNQGIKRLIMPGGMGDMFKVLIQSTGVRGASLGGFGFKDLKEAL